MPSSRSDRDFLKELKRKDKKRRKQKKKRRHHSDSSSDSSSEDSDMDLQKELQPISNYVNDREEMINQVFSVIHGKKLRSMLPPFLADLDTDEVKALCLEQLIGMSKKRVLCTLSGQEMVDSSDTDDEDEEPKEEAAKQELDSDSDEEENRVRGKGESSVSQDPNAATNLKKVHRIKIAKKPQTKIILKGDKNKNGKEKQKEEDDKGKTLMELLELEMRARAIKALLMKSGKNESEAETQAIEEALDEQKKKQEKQKGLVENASTMKEKHLRKKTDDSDDELNENEAENAVDEKDESDEEPERVFNSENNAMSKARDALLLSESKKRIEDEIKSRKEEEAKFLYEEQLRKEKEEEEREQREKLVKEVKMMKQKLIEEEQEQRRKKIEEEREKMRLDHERKEALKQIKDKEKLLSKIQAMKDEEEKEKEELEEHYKTKIQKKVVDRVDDEDSNPDDEEEQKHRRYRKKDEEDDASDEERRLYDRSSSRSSSRSPRRRPYSRGESEEEAPSRRSAGKTRLRKKVADGSDVEDGEVEEVDSDAEDEIEREEDQVNLLEKMKNLRKKFSEMEDVKTEEEKNSNPSSPQPQSSRGGRGRGRGGVRGRGRGRGKPGQEDDEEWSMQKYDFDAPDIKEAVESHKPNFVKDQNTSEKDESQSTDGKEKEDRESNPKSTFKRVSREEWNKMTKAAKKKYLKDRKKWKLSQTVFIKDDSDNEQLTDDNESEGDDLKYSDSEDEKEKQDRLAREALKSYAGAFEKEEAPTDYKLVMRKDVVEHELADTDNYRYETVEDIEIREKREKLEMKEQERKAKMREERLRRMQAFQASSVLREEPVDDQEHMEVEVETRIEKLVPEDDKQTEDNPFYTSYEALEKKDVLEDPLKEERERVKAQQEEDEKELKKIHHQHEASCAVFDDTDIAPPQKKAKIEIGSMSLGALKSIIETEKEKIQNELDVEEEKTKHLEKAEQDVRKKKAEQVLRRGKRRGDPNNPSKEEVDAAQELEQMTWQDRYMKNRKVKDVVEKSQLLSKVKNKMKEEKKERDQEAAPGLNDPPAVSDKKEEKSEEEKSSMIGSIEEYASLVGKSVSKLADTKYDVPDVEEEDEEEESDKEGDDLWGAIMGGS